MSTVGTRTNERTVGYKVEVTRIVEYDRIRSEWEPLTRDGDHKAEYGYAPKREVRQREEVGIYEQQVDDLDLAKVIASVNGLYARHAQAAKEA